MKAYVSINKLWFIDFIEDEGKLYFIYVANNYYGLIVTKHLEC